MTQNLLKGGGALLIAVLMSNCSTTKPSRASKMVVSVADQRLVVFDQEGKPKKSYPVSTSKFGLGDRPGSYKTPVGKMVVREKVGGGAKPGTVFKGRKPTGEVLKPNSPGRDPIVSRIMWLGGAQESTRNAYGRCIYIHGTAEEWRVGTPASYGCIRMKSKDVIDLYETVGVGSAVYVKPNRLYSAEIPKQDTMLVNNLRRRNSLGMGTGEILAAADASNSRPSSRRSLPQPAPVKRTVVRKSVPTQQTHQQQSRQQPPELSRRRGMFDR